VVTQAHFFRDATEDRHNSFSRQDEASLRTVKGRLTLEVHLAAEDPRLYDLERSILGKLRRTRPDVAIDFTDMGMHNLLSSGVDRYGQVVYRYQDRQAVSRSTSEEEVLPLVFEILGLKRIPTAEAAAYRGYPLVAGTHWAGVAFYIFLPLIVLFFWGLPHFPLRFWKKIGDNS
jgi:hypothetical protein